MKLTHRTIFSLLLVILAISLASCSGAGQANTPQQAVEAYIQALVGKDANQLVNSACAAWEAQARQELRTFDAVTVTLEGLACQETDRQDDTARLACQGKIVANYGNEILELNLADRAYQAVLEGGEWRMCGYP